MQQARRRFAPWRVAVVLALAVAAYAAITVTPAVAAATDHGVSACEPTIFDGLNSLGSAAASARGDVAREPSLDQVVTDLPASAKGKAARQFTSATVPVYFHVVSAGAEGAIPQSVIDDQMDVLNAAFAGFYGGAASGFSFTLAGVTRTDNAEWFAAGPGSPDERAMKRTLHQGGLNALNLYSTTAAGFLGWAYFPGLTPPRQYLDGIVVDWESMPGASDKYEGVFDLGHTATHEAGHWLHLHHTFNGGCNAKGDYVEDTPAMKVPTGGCPDGKDTCRESGLDPIHNYMDYSDDPCYNQFTAGQVQRMQDSWLEFRS